MTDELRDNMNELNFLDITGSREEFIESIKILDRKVMEKISSKNRLKWRPGKGLEISQNLSGWKDAVIRKLLSYTGGLPADLAVVAVGGYGRGELSPYSDIDLLVLSRKNLDYKQTDFVQKFLTIFWDLGYKLGNSVRTFSELSVDARDDLQFMTALFAARLISGDELLFSKIEGEVRKVAGKMRMKYLRRSSEEIYSIIRNAGNEVLVKEPDLKNSGGGLRSVHLMQWLNAAFHGNAALSGLSALFTGREFRRLFYAYDLTLYIRNLLHFLSGHKEDVLRMEYQESAARVLGIGTGGKEAMVHLMKRIYEKAMDILLLLLQTADRFTVKFEKGKMKPQDEGKYKVFQKLFFVNESLKPDPQSALQAILFCVKEKYRYSYALIHYLRASASLLNHESRQNRSLFLLFREILSQPNSYEALTALRLSGFLYRYLPPFKMIKNQIVYNPFHQYTIDQHSLESVRALEMLDETLWGKQDLPRFKTLITLSQKYSASIWVAKLALLLHDTGKAFEGDHAKNSAEISRIFLKNYPTDTLIKDMIIFLTENHLLLSNIVRRSGIDSKSAVSDLAREFILSPYPEEYLEILYLVSYADIFATNPKNYSGYIAAQLNELYKNTLSIIQSSDEGKTAESRAELILKKVLESHSDPKILDFARDLGEKYLLSNQPEEIQDDFLQFQKLTADQHEVRVTIFNDHLKVKIISSDRIGLFSILSGILLLNGADIVRADIHTYQGVAVDEFIITSVHGNDVLEDQMDRELEVWIEDLKRSLIHYLKYPSDLHGKIEQSKAYFRRLPDVFRREPRITFGHPVKDVYRVEISCTDRPALLYDITHLFSSAGLEVRNAVIDTSGWYVHDIFEVADNKSLSEKKRAELKKELERLTEFPHL